MIFGKFTVRPKDGHLPTWKGSFDGQSTVIGKVHLGTFAGRYQGVRVNRERYVNAYTEIALNCPEMAQKKIDTAARAIARENFKAKTVRELYVEIRAVWDNGKWRYIDPTDSDITPNGDGVRIQADICEVSPVCALYPGLCI